MKNNNGMKYSNIKYFCTANGNGIRTALFVSGCKFHCKGCFNQKAWDFNYGKQFTTDVLLKILKSIEPEYVSGLSILGGEPLNEENIMYVDTLINEFRKKFGDKKDIWLWTGYYLNEMTYLQEAVAKKCNYIVDGRFEIDKFKVNLKFKGSTNQTIWHNENGEFKRYVEKK